MATGFATKPAEPSEFVREQRPDRIDYMAVGVPPAARPTAPKSAADVKAAEESLAATRAANEALGAEAKAAGQTPPPAPASSPAR